MIKKNNLLTICFLFLFNIVLACIFILLKKNEIIIYMSMLILIITMYFFIKNDIISPTFFFLICYIYAVALGPIWYCIREKNVKININIFIYSIIFYLFGVFIYEKIVKIIYIKNKKSIFAKKYKMGLLSKKSIIYILYSIACLATCIYAIKNRVYLLNDIQTNRINAMSGNGFLLLMIKMFIIAVPLLWEEYWKKKCSFLKVIIMSIIGCSMLLVTGFKSPCVTTIIVVLIMYFSKFNIKLKKMIFIGIMLVILILLLDNLRNMISGEATTSLLKKLESLTSVGLYNFNRVYDAFPEKIDFQKGHTYVLNLLMLRPGPDLDFTLWLKESLGMTFAGGGVTPTIIGDFYINFGFYGMFIGMFMLGIIGGKLGELLKVYKGEFWISYLTWQYCHIATGGISNVWVEVSIFCVIYIISMFFCKREDRILVK